MYRIREKNCQNIQIAISKVSELAITFFRFGMGYWAALASSLFYSGY